MTVQAVSFDLDGTLYDAQPFRRAYVWRNLLFLRTITTTRRVREGLRGLAFEDGSALFAEQHRQVAARLGRSEAKVAEQCDRLFGDRVCQALARVGSGAGVRDGLEALVVLPKSEARDALEVLGRYLVERTG